MWETTKKMFGDNVLVALGVVWTTVTTFILPTSLIRASAVAVLLMMGLDLLTRLFAIAKQNGGIRNAIRTHKITSTRFAKGTIDKLIIFGVVLVINGCAHRILVIEDISKWFTQAIFTIMFLRDTLSIFENLGDSGVQGLGIFKRMIKKKCEEIIGEDEDK